MLGTWWPWHDLSRKVMIKVNVLTVELHLLGCPKCMVGAFTTYPINKALGNDFKKCQNQVFYVKCQMWPFNPIITIATIDQTKLVAKWYDGYRSVEVIWMNEKSCFTCYWSAQFVKIEQKIEFYKTDDLDMTLTQPFWCLQLFLFFKSKVKTLFEHFSKCGVLVLVRF